MAAQTQSENFADPADIDAILAMKTIAVVGLSPDPGRESNSVARYLRRRGYDIIPVNPTVNEALGKTSYPSVSALPEAPDVVDIFRRPAFVGEIVEQAIQKGARAVWMQLGVVNPRAARRAREAGLLVVMDRCMQIESMKRS